MGSEDYPLVRRVYLHTGQLITALGRTFGQWIVSPAGKAVFDSRGRQGMERLAAYLQRPESSGRRVILMAFANPQLAAPMQPLFLSQERADYVSSELLALNMKLVTVRGLGGRMNLLDPSQAALRYRNERVEVWLR